MCVSRFEHVMKVFYKRWNVPFTLSLMVFTGPASAAVCGTGRLRVTTTNFIGKCVLDSSVCFHRPVQRPAALIITDAPPSAEPSLCLFPSVNRIRHTAAGFRWTVHTAGLLLCERRGDTSKTITGHVILSSSNITKHQRGPQASDHPAMQPGLATCP